VRFLRDESGKAKTSKTGTGTVIVKKDCIETPFGRVTLPLEKVLDVMCELGYEEVIVSGAEIPEVETGAECWKCDVGEVDEVEWETPRSIIEKLKSSEKSRVCGAIAMFVGFVRELNEGRRVLWLEYERNDELYGKKLDELKRRIESYPGVEGVEIFHRTGKVGAGEDIVYVAVMGKGRKDVWRAIVDAVEGMKKELPVWKKEVFEGGEEWL